MLEVDEVDRVIELRPANCTRCGCRVLEQDRLFPARQQVVEITAAGTQTTEYQRHARRGVRPAQSDGVDDRSRRRNFWRARVEAVIGYLTGRLGLSHRDVVEAMKELLAVKISLGSICAVQKRISIALARPVEAITQFIGQQSVTSVDETSWREKEQRPWLWVKSTSRATVFQILPGRRTIDAQTMIGENVKGLVTTDR